METSKLQHFSNYHQLKASEAKSTEALVYDAITALNVRNYEAVYVLDCRKMEIIHKSESFEKVTGIKRLPSKRIDLFYGENFSQSTLEGVANNIEKRVKIIYETNLWTYNDVHQEIVELANGRLLLKSSFIFLRDEFGRTTHSSSFVRDVTPFMSKGYKHQFIGPNGKELNAVVHNMTEFVKVLTEREMQILFLIGKGYSSRQIGQIINLSRHTVDTHRRKILKKLESTNSYEAYKKANDMGILSNV